MWGAVPQHHQAIHPAQAQQLNAMAQAAVQAQVHARMQGAGAGGPAGLGPGPAQALGMQNGYDDLIGTCMCVHL